MTPPILFGSQMRWVRADGQSYWVAIHKSCAVRMWESEGRHYWQTRLNGIVFCHGDAVSRRLAVGGIKRVLDAMRKDAAELMRGATR